MNKRSITQLNDDEEQYGVSNILVVILLGCQPKEPSDAMDLQRLLLHLSLYELLGTLTDQIVRVRIRHPS